MSIERVVVTGMGAVSPFGRGAEALINSIIEMKSSVIKLPDLMNFGGMRTRVAALVPDIGAKEIPRKYRRSMSKMSVYAALAAQEASQMGRLTEENYSSGRMGVSIGSTIGSPIATQGFFEDFISTRSLEMVKSTLFFQIMNHSCAANVAQALGITGRILAPSSACATSCQAVGYGYEMIAFGKQDIMLCGGADEYHPLTSSTFDIINAASVNYNDRPQATPRPFDRDRDGVVCSEGSGILLLESLASAERRGAKVYAEVAGFATVADPSSIADPDIGSIETCIKKALDDAGIEPGEVDYINAHATGTKQGDIAESHAINHVFGRNVPVSSLKGHLGHTMAACGSLEMIATIAMMNDGFLIPTLNLDNIDPLCADIKYIRKLEKRPIGTVLKNNFALGGVNTCIILRRFNHD